MRTGTITWMDIHGMGTLVLRWDDGERETLPHDDDIEDCTDSSSVAAKFGEFDSVDHDGEYIHVGRIEKADREAWQWAVAEQGYTGDLGDWLALPADERQTYEDGAAGLGTV